MRAMLALLVLAAFPAHAQAVRVVDGDTLKVGAEYVRLLNIDAPEIGQACRDRRGLSYDCGIAAAAALQGLINGRQLRCNGASRDQYDRTLAHCFVADTDLGAALVEMGHARAYVTYSNQYLPQENLARKAGVGIWAGDHQAPWTVRGDPGPARATGTGCMIKGNVSSKGERIYHVPGQDHYSRTQINLAKGERWFCNEDEARAAGWRRARR